MKLYTFKSGNIYCSFVCDESYLNEFMDKYVPKLRHGTYMGIDLGVKHDWEMWTMVDWEPITKENKETETMKKYYRAKQDSFLWVKGAILVSYKELGSCMESYRPVDDTDIWDTTEFNGEECISAPIVEKNPDWFERVYPVNLLSKIVYKLKAEAQEMMSKEVSE